MGAGAIWRLTPYRRVNHAFIQLSNNSLLSPECTKYSASAEGVLGNPGQPFLMLITTVCGLRGAGSSQHSLQAVQSRWKMSLARGMRGWQGETF